MHVLTLILALALQQVVNNGQASIATHTARQQPARSPTSFDAQGVPTPSTHPDQDKADQHKDGSNDIPYAIEIKKQPPPEDTPLFKWYLLATAFGVAVNAFIWVAIWQQTKLNRKVAKAAQDSADAAKKSADTAESALRLSERADILVDEVGLSTGQEINAYTDVVLQFKNFGRTRAKNAVFTLDLVIPGIPNSAKAMGPMILAAGATQSIRFNFVASVADKFPQINRGEVKMVFIGEVRYTDAFDGPHTTHASGTYDPGRRGFRVEENWGD